MRVTLVMAAALGLAGAGNVQAGPENCAKLTDAKTRLACYDALFGAPAGASGTASDKAGTTTRSGGDTAPDAADAGKWQIQFDTSKMTDQKNVFLTLDSDNEVPGTYGGSGPARLVLRCMENTTAVMLVVNDHFMADIQGYGRVEYRLDKEKATHLSMAVSTDNKALGLWSGGRAIPFVKGLIGHDRLVMRATPFNESSYTLTFDLAGLSAVLPDLREACNW